MFFFQVNPALGLQEQPHSKFGRAREPLDIEGSTGNSGRTVCCHEVLEILGGGSVHLHTHFPSAE